jgi:predicted acyltransferase
MALSFFLFLVGTLGVWRLTHLLAAEDGPWDVIVRLRRAADQSVWGRLLDCFYCLSLWVAAPFAAALGDGWRSRLLLWPALSAAAILIERCMPVRRPEDIPLTARYTEDKEVSDVLRQPQEQLADIAGSGAP